MKVFVTGASGFTGSHLVRSLINRGDEVTVLVRRSSDLSRLKDLPVKLVYGDLGDRAALDEAMGGVDWVFHVAAYVELGIVDADKMARINVDGTRNMLAAAKKAGVSRFLYCSTIGVFGDTQGRVVDETFEREQRGFDSPYDETKYTAQKLVDEAGSSGLSVVSVMPSGIFGGDDPHFGPVVRQFLKGGLRLWAGGKRMTGIVHVDDLVDGMLVAMEKGGDGEWYILSAGDLSTKAMFTALGRSQGVAPPAEAPEFLVRLLGNILDVVGRLFNWQPPISRERVYYIYDRCVRVTSAKAQEQLGWQPRPVLKVLEDTVAELPK
ncbi:MAG: NAD-dependent epimerase/dehydratase family protein [Cyanophyceae cyanobacterium]